MEGLSLVRFAVLFLLTTALGIAIGCNLGSQPPNVAGDPSSNQLPFTEAKSVPVPAGTVIYVRLQQSLSSSNAHTGQEFAAVLDEPLVVENQTIVPRGVPLTGRVVAVRESGRLRNAGYIRITLSAITLNGKPAPLETNSVFAGGGSYRKHDLAFIGGGAGGGAVLGGLAGGGKGAAVGSFVGAAGGTTGAYVAGKKEVGFNTEQRLGFLLTQPFNVSVNN